MGNVSLYIDGDIKSFRSPEYNYDFNINTGYTEMWGNTKDESPDFSPYGPLIADIEIDERCSGIPDANGVYAPCVFCYKANTPDKGKYMTLQDFKSLVDKFPKYNGIHYLTQIAFGATDINGHPEIWDIMKYCHSIGIIPNITVNGALMTDEIVDNLVNLCGAVSVSVYERNPDVCYDAVQRLIKAGASQINIHLTYHSSNIDFCKNVINTVSTDERLKGLQAVVLLALKQKGRGKGFSPIDDKNFKDIVSMALSKGVGLGFDSCSATRVERVFSEMGILNKFQQYIEKCESGLQSFYCNVDSVYFPCSFCEDVEQGIDIKQIDSIYDDVWNAKVTGEWREKLLKCKRDCPVFNV